MKYYIQEKQEISQPTDVVAIWKLCSSLTELVQQRSLIGANSVANVSLGQANLRDMPKHTPKRRFLSAKPVGSVFATQDIACNMNKYIQKPSQENARSGVLSNLHQNTQKKSLISANNVTKVSQPDGD